MSSPLAGVASPEGTAACLAVVCELHGRPRSREVVGALLQREGDPASAAGLVSVARLLGFRARPVSVAASGDLRFVPRGALLRLGAHGTLVFDGVESRRVMVIDPVPVRSRRPLSPEEVRAAASGQVFEMEPLSAQGRSPGTTVRAAWRLLRQEARTIAAVLVASLLLQLLALSGPLLTGLLAGHIIPRNDLQLLTLVAAGFVVVVTFQYLASLAREYALILLQTRINRDLTLQFFDHLVALPYSFFFAHSRGDLLMRAKANGAIRDFLAGGAISVVLDGLITLLYLLLLLAASPRLALLTLAIGAAEAIIVAWGRRRLLAVNREVLARRARTQGFLVEMLAGMEQIKAMGTEAPAHDRWWRLYQRELAQSLAGNRIETWLGATTGALGLGGRLAVLLSGAGLVLSRDLPLGTMLACNTLAIGCLVPLSRAVTTLLDLQVLAVDVERIDEIRLSRPEQEGERLVPARRLGGEIRLDGVSFRYGPDGPPVLHEVSCEIRRGEMVALVGRSGAGKSTLASLLIGLQVPTAGRVLLDGQDLQGLDLHAIRRQMGFVPQAPFVLGGCSLRENIALGHPDLSFEAIVAAAERAHIHREILELPMQYETVAPERGAGFSGGQGQRLALARAIAHHPAVLILDEATSSLDTATEAAIARSLQELRCTRVVIAHRLSTVVRADRILVLDHGRLCEQGTHLELMERRGVYHRLVSSQLQGPACRA